MDAVQTAIKDKIIVVQGRQVILDSDVAALYGVETKRVNEAIKNNPDNSRTGTFSSLPRQNGKICGRKFRPQNPQRSAMPPKPLPKRDFICWRQS